MNRASPGEKENHLIGTDVVVVVAVVLRQSYRCRRLRRPLEPKR